MMRNLGLYVLTWCDDILDMLQLGHLFESYDGRLCPVYRDTPCSLCRDIALQPRANRKKTSSAYYGTEHNSCNRLPGTRVSQAVRR